MRWLVCCTSHTSHEGDFRAKKVIPERGWFFELSRRHYLAPHQRIFAQFWAHAQPRWMGSILGPSERFMLCELPSCVRNLTADHSMCTSSFTGDQQSSSASDQNNTRNAVPTSPILGILRRTNVREGMVVSGSVASCSIRLKNQFNSVRQHPATLVEEKQVGKRRSGRYISFQSRNLRFGAAESDGADQSSTRLCPLHSLILSALAVCTDSLAGIIVWVTWV